MLWLPLNEAVAAFKVFKELRSYSNWAGDAWQVWRNGRLRIFLVGCGGAGKTSLRRFLASTGSGVENIPSQHEPTQVRKRDTGKKIERFSFVYDYPGQGEKFWDELNRDGSTIHDAPRAIVIMCCAYGFHSDWGQSGFVGRRVDTLKDQTVSERNFKNAFEDCKENEITFLQKFLERAQGMRNELTMITAVLKLDLWFNENKEVDDFYSGAYQEIIEESKKHFARQLRHEFQALSLRQENFVASLGPIKEEFQIKPGFSSSHEEAYKGLFLRTLGDLAQRTLE